MGISNRYSLLVSIRTQFPRCLHAAKVVKLRETKSPDHQELVFSFQLDVFIDSCARVTMPNELEQALPFTWPQLWSILLLKSWNLPAMLPVTTRKQGLFRDISNWLSEMTRN